VAPIRNLGFDREARHAGRGPLDKDEAGVATVIFRAALDKRR
jgi:hypothetical protein